MISRGARVSGTLNSGLDILETLAGEPGGLGVTEIARRTALDKGNVHRLLRLLEARGYVEQDIHSKKFTASALVLSLARTVLQSIDLLPAARRVMQDLSDACGESVHLAKRTRPGGIYIAQIRQPARVSIQTEIGAQPVVHASATGKALYFLDDDETLKSVLEFPLTQFTPRTITSVDALRAELACVVERGYAVDDEELTPGVRCVAAPIFDMYGEVTACIGISGPTSRVPQERLGELGEKVRVAASNITQNVGGRLPRILGAHPHPSMEVHQ